MRYRKKPVEVEAHFFDGVFHLGLQTWLDDAFMGWYPSERVLDIATPSGVSSVNAGHWLVKDEVGFHVLIPEEFAATYEAVEQ